MPLPPLPLRERRVFVDSSAYLALLDTDDEHHREAIETLQELAAARYRQFTTNVLRIDLTPSYLAGRPGSPASKTWRRVTP
jgi:predicted nucleic acid-binding protein